MLLFRTQILLLIILKKRSLQYHLKVKCGIVVTSGGQHFPQSVLCLCHKFGFVVGGLWKGTHVLLRVPWRLSDNLSWYEDFVGNQFSYLQSPALSLNYLDFAYGLRLYHFFFSFLLRLCKRSTCYPPEPHYSALLCDSKTSGC